MPFSAAKRTVDARHRLQKREDGFPSQNQSRKISGSQGWGEREVRRPSGRLSFLDFAPIAKLCPDAGKPGNTERGSEQANRIYASKPLRNTHIWWLRCFPRQPKRDNPMGGFVRGCVRKAQPYDPSRAHTHLMSKDDMATTWNQANQAHMDSKLNRIPVSLGTHSFALER